MSHRRNKYSRYEEQEEEVSDEVYRRNIQSTIAHIHERQRGRKGTKVMLTSNFLKVEVDRNSTFYVYPIEFEDDRLRRETREKVVDELEYFMDYNNHDCIVTSNSVVTASKADYISSERAMKISVQIFPGRPKKPFRISFPEEIELSFANEVVEEYQEKEQTLNHILHRILSTEEVLTRTYTPKQLGHSKHYRGKQPIQESKRSIRGMRDTYLNKQVFQTYSISFTSREKGWYLLISPAFRTSEEPYSGTEVMEYFHRFLSQKHQPRDIDGILKREIEEKYVISHLIYARNRRTTKKISKVRFDLRPLSKPDFGDHETYVDYYLKCYGEQLREIGITKREDINPHQPLFQVDPPPEHFRGQESLNKTLYYIPQLVGIRPDDVDMRKYKMDWASRYTRESLDGRIRKVRNFIELLKRSNVKNRLQKYGIHVDLERELERCEATTLPSLTLKNHFDKAVYCLEQGTNWEREMKKLTLKGTIRGTGRKLSMSKLVCIYCDGFREEKDFALQQIAGFGWDKYITTPGKGWAESIPSYALPSGGRLVPLLERIQREERPDLILMIPNERRDLYNDLITFCMREGIVEQVIRGATLRYKKRIRKQIMYNIFLQMYCKLGGFLWNVDSFLHPFIDTKRTNTMLIGVDASRETQRNSYNGWNSFRKRTERKYKPSCYAVVAAVLEKEWTSRQSYLLSSKRGSQEISGNALTDAFRFFIDEFRRTFPDDKKIDRVIIFRDGVANTQVKKLRDEEIDGIIQLMKEIAPETKLSFLLIQKRVKAFFSLTSGLEKRSGPTSNPDPGSVINNGITFSQMQIKSFYLNTDFYLVSSSGTGDFSSKPCHYLLLHNDESDAGKEEEEAEGEEAYDIETELQKLTFACCNLYFGFRGTIKTPFVAQCAHKLADKIYKSVFVMKKSRFSGKARDLCLKAKFLCLKEKKEYDGDYYEEVRRNGEVRICVHKNFYDKWFEL